MWGYAQFRREKAEQVDAHRRGRQVVYLTDASATLADAVDGHIGDVLSPKTK